MHQVRQRDRVRAYVLRVSLIVGVVAVILGSSCFFDTRNTLCENGMLCPAGWVCTEKQDGCHRDGCGDGVPKRQEECDDGNKVNGDGCDNNCTLPLCGNGIAALDESGMAELCDDANEDNGDGCDNNCQPTGCHNGIRTDGEQCDDDNSDNNDACVDYCVPAKCGDGYLWIGAEECDDGNTITERCAYDARSCTVCDAACHLANGITAFCGDGVMQMPNEACDDGNEHCGTCSSNCQMYASAEAAGQIAVLKADDMRDSSDSFTLDDGFNPSIVFNLNMTGVSVLGISVGYPGGSATDVRNAVAQAINLCKNASLLLITAPVDTDPGSVVTLTHVRSSSVGNVKIAETVEGSGFTAIGMKGGKGGDCLRNDQCRSNEDCKSNLCLPSTNTCGCMLDIDCPGSAPLCASGSCVP